MVKHDIANVESRVQFSHVAPFKENIMGYYDDDLKELVGKTLTDIRVIDATEIYFETSDGDTWKMWHEQDCCESVYLEDVVGDLNDLLNTPIIVAEDVSNTAPDTPASSEYPDESFTWTFYNFRTIKGDVTLRWYGSSNGYYSESVSFRKV